jgi:glycosyltransferase involved in cell wall biosynthesis
VAYINVGSEAPSVSVVIAAYNEERFIAQTLESVLRTGVAHEVIVVDDGSSDGTPRILADYSGPISVVTHAANRGKGAAVATGIRRATGDIVVLCDAHLLGLERSHLLALIEPLREDLADVTLGVAVSTDNREGAMRLTPTAILTGQRAYRRRHLLPLLAEMESLGYGVETFLHTRHVRDRTLVVRLPGLVHLTKRHKSTPSDALTCYLREAREIALAASEPQVLWHLATFRAARRVMSSDDRVS